MLCFDFKRAINFYSFQYISFLGFVLVHFVKDFVFLQFAQVYFAIYFQGLLKVSAKSKEWFPIQPTQKWWNFLEQGEDRNFKFDRLVLSKTWIAWGKTDTAVSSPDTEGLSKVSAKSELWFPFQPIQKWWNLSFRGNQPMKF